jgi:hypothetical protein
MGTPDNDQRRRRALGWAALGLLAIVLGLTLLWLTRVP